MSRINGLSGGSPYDNEARPPIARIRRDIGLQDDFGASTVGGIDPMSPDSGFLKGPGTGDSKATVILRPAAGAAPGWAGFLGWVAANHPQVYNYLRAAHGDAVQAIEQSRSATMSTGLGDDAAPVDDATAAALNLPQTAAAQQTNTGSNTAGF